MYRLVALARIRHTFPVFVEDHQHDTEVKASVSLFVAFLTCKLKVPQKIRAVATRMLRFALSYTGYHTTE